jgi:hypothetical protein
LVSVLINWMQNCLHVVLFAIRNYKLEILPACPSPNPICQDKVFRIVKNAHPDIAATALMGAYKKSVNREPPRAASYLTEAGMLAGDRRVSTGCPKGEHRCCRAGMRAGVQSLFRPCE